MFSTLGTLIYGPSKLWNSLNYGISAMIKKKKDTQPSAAKHGKASRKIMEESLPSHLLTNVSGLSSLKELPAAVPVYEIAEQEKGYHTAANIQNRTKAIKLIKESITELTGNKHYHGINTSVFSEFR